MVMVLNHFESFLRFILFCHLFDRILNNHHLAIVVHIHWSFVPNLSEYIFLAQMLRPYVTIAALFISLSGQNWFWLVNPEHPPPSRPMRILSHLSCAASRAKQHPTYGYKREIFTKISPENYWAPEATPV